MSKAYRAWKEKQKKAGKKYSFSLFKQDVHKTQKFYKNLKILRILGKERRPIGYRFWNYLEEVEAGRINPTVDYSYCPYCYCKQKEKNDEQKIQKLEDV